MTVISEAQMAQLLGSVRPRDGFAAELLAALVQDGHRLQQIPSLSSSHRSRWLIAGAVAGVASATGVAYLAVRRHRGAA